MATTFDKFITAVPEQKEKFDREYEQFLLSEFVLEQMQEKKLSVRKLAELVGVSPTVIQKIRSCEAEKINFSTFQRVLNTLGYKIKLEKI